MNYQLQTINSDQTGFERIAGLYQSAKNLFADKLTIDLSGASFFDANMASPLGTVLARITDKLNSIEFVNIPKKIEEILRRNLFLTNFQFPELADHFGTTMPYLRLQTTDGRSFEDYIQREFRGKGIPRMSEKLSKMFKKKVFEVFQNAVIHSETTLGVCVCGQYYPNVKRLDIAVTDAGVGIREKVREYFNNQKISSVAAIQWALKEHNTTKRGPQPGGLGFKFLHEFISRNKGKIKIASRFGFYQYGNGSQSFSKMAADFPGTAVTIEINTADTTNYYLLSGARPGNVS